MLKTKLNLFNCEVVEAGVKLTPRDGANFNVVEYIGVMSKTEV